MEVVRSFTVASSALLNLAWTRGICPPGLALAVTASVLFLAAAGCERPSDGVRVKPMPKVPIGSAVVFDGGLTNTPEVTLPRPEADTFIGIINTEPQQIVIPPGCQYPVPYGRFHVAGRDYGWYGDYAGIEVPQGKTVVRLAWHHPSFARMHEVLRKNRFSASEAVYREVLGAFSK